MFLIIISSIYVISAICLFILNRLAIVMYDKGLRSVNPRNLKGTAFMILCPLLNTLAFVVYAISLIAYFVNRSKKQSQKQKQ